MGSYVPPLDINRVAIIGAGPIGLACCKYLLAEKCFDVVDIYEQRENVGGVWNLTANECSRKVHVPQMDPSYGSKNYLLPINAAKDHASRQVNRTNGHVRSDELEFETPLYSYLETNIPKQMMAYSDKPFAEDLPLFPGHREVLNYLEEYAKEVRHLIQFRTKVVDVRTVFDEQLGRETWLLTAQDLDTGEMKEGVIYDAVIAANGHYTVPRIPDIRGIREWDEAYPGTIAHSKAHRRPDEFRGKTVIVVGNSASGLDISSAIAQHGPKRLIVSARSAGMLPNGSKIPWAEAVDKLEEFLSPRHHDRAVKSKNGVVIDHVDAIIFATGYFYNFPFLSTLTPPIISDGFRTRDVFQHFLHIDHPTLALPVLNLKVIPFPLAENQAAVIARIWSGRLSLPTKEEMKEWEAEEMKRKGSEKDFHLKKFPEDATQINDLHQWAASATPAEGLEDDGNGKLGTTWGRREVWMRSKFPDFKGAFAKRGPARHEIRTIGQLGFNFEEWLRKAQPQDTEMFEEAHCEK